MIRELAGDEAVAAGVAAPVFVGPETWLPEGCSGVAGALRGICKAPKNRLEITHEVVQVGVGEARILAGSAAINTGAILNGLAVVCVGDACLGLRSLEENLLSTREHIIP